MLAGRLPTREEAARLLGVSPTADEAAIRRAFRAWAALVHPDHGGHPRQFQALCVARDVLLEPVIASERGAHDPVIAVRPRESWRDVLIRPRGAMIVALALALIVVAVSILAAGSSPLLVLPAAVASAAWCVAVSKTVLQGPDHGHIIVTRTVAWCVATAVQGIVAVLAGIPLIEALPLLAVPFVAVIAAVNPAAGLWRSARR